MAGFNEKLNLKSLKTVLILFIVLSLIVTGGGYMLMRSRESAKLTNLDHYQKTLAGIMEKQKVLSSNLNEARLNMLEYLLAHDEIKRYQALYAIKEMMPLYDAWKEAIPAELVTRDLNGIMKNIHFKLDSLDETLLSLLSEDGKLPEISDFNATDSTSSTNDIFEISGRGAERLKNGGIDKKFDHLQNSFLNFEITLDKVLSDRISTFYSKSNLDILIGFIISMGLIFWLFIYLFRRSIHLSIIHSGQVLEKISAGEVPDKVEEKDDEFKIIRKSSNKLIDYLKDASNFAVQIGEGNFNRTFKPKSDRDLLGNALMEMSDRLATVAKEDKVRNWMNEGRAKFANILRQYGNNIQELGDRLISGLVDYLGAVQGGLFVVSDEGGTSYLELLSAFAYDRKKYEKRKIQPGEGLAGQVFLERKEIYIKDLKEEHFYIQTGMGSSRPASVLIVPLMDENNIEGVLELASLKELDEHQITFVKQVAESIASSLRSGKVNLKTRQLLDETRQKAEEMAAQEEELRQNMEELAATQEQMERLRDDEEKMRKEIEGRQNLLTGILNKIPEQVFVKDRNGKIILLNQAMADACGKKVEELLGTSGFESYPPDEAKRLHDEEMRIIGSGEVFDNPEEQITDQDGHARVFWSRKIPMYISYLDQTGLLCIRTDITKDLQLKEELKKREKRIKEIEKQLQNGLDKKA